MLARRGLLRLIVPHSAIPSSRTLTTRALVFSELGNIRNVLSLHSWSIPDHPAPNSVLVKFLAAPINPADLNQVEGVYPSKAKFGPMQRKMGDWAVGGNEGVVKIVEVGEDVSKDVRAEGIEPGRWAIMKYPAFGLSLGGKTDERDLEDVCLCGGGSSVAVTYRIQDRSCFSGDDLCQPLHGGQNDYGVRGP
jgi:hypothetical protein